MHSNFLCGNNKESHNTYNKGHPTRRIHEFLSPPLVLLSNVWSPLLSFPAHFHNPDLSFLLVAVQQHSLSRDPRISDQPFVDISNKCRPMSPVCPSRSAYVLSYSIFPSTLKLFRKSSFHALTMSRASIFTDHSHDSSPGSTTHH